MSSALSDPAPTETMRVVIAEVSPAGHVRSRRRPNSKSRTPNVFANAARSPDLCEPDAAKSQKGAHGMNALDSSMHDSKSWEEAILKEYGQHRI